MQLNETISTTGIDIRAVEPEFSYLQPTKERPEYWNNLGSSKSRSAIQAEEARNVMRKVVKETGTDSVSGFTDGSSRGNPRPCGAGACLFFPSQERIDLKRRFKEVTLFSDSQSAVGILTLGWQNSCINR